MRPFDYPPGAIPAPPGTYVNAWQQTHIGAAAMDWLVISRHEWFSGGAELGPEGLRHVAAISEVVMFGDAVVLIEAATVDLGYDGTYAAAQERAERLNELRRANVVARLTAAGVADAEQRVHVEPIDRIGVRGVEAPLIFNRQIQGGFGRRGGGVGGRFGGGLGGGIGGGFGGGFY